MGGEKKALNVGILTLYYHNYNYGGQLQAYALCRFLNCLPDVTCEQISFCNPGNQREKRGLKSLCFPLYSRFRHPLIFLKLHQRKKRIESFSDQITQSIPVDQQALHFWGQQYDRVVVGSDQVWHPKYGSRCFFLDFLPGEKRCAYGASFGADRFDTQWHVDALPSLRKFNLLTVREKAAQLFLTQHGIWNAKVVCDPTLLLSREAWERHLDKIPALIGSQTLFAYLLGDRLDTRQHIKAKAAAWGGQIASIPHVHFSYQKRDRNFADIDFYQVGPWEFLRLIRDAEIIVTDSFHCTLFCILFEKNFWSVQREPSGKDSTSNRLLTLLSKAGLTERFVPSAAHVDLYKSVNYTGVKERLEPFIEQSKDLLQTYFAH